MQRTDDRIPATEERPERFKVYVCPDLACSRWWPAEYGSGWCDADWHDSAPVRMRPLTLIAEKDAHYPAPKSEDAPKNANKIRNPASHYPVREEGE